MGDNDFEIMLYKKSAVVNSKRKVKDILLNNKLLLVLNKTAKRFIDISCGIIGVILLIPITIIVLFLNFIYREKGTIFFSQERIGKDGKLFKMYKYRTMKINAEEELKKILRKSKEAREEYKKNKKLKNDPRVTKVGEFLRKTSLDEFPQFINVLKGDMSLVGPRPYLPREQKDMGYYYHYICKCKPGITGLWQTSGRSDVSFNERLDLDIKYYQEETVISDIGLVAKTVIKTIKREGAL
ncbi:MAG TPA: sugar transferase [Clostridia bacterium]|nr:sugar transferase [Clostridia bacterium]